MATQLRDTARIATLIESARHRRGWTQEQLAEVSGLSVRTIRNLERDVIEAPRSSTLTILARHLDLDRSELLEPTGFVEDGRALVGRKSLIERAAAKVQECRVVTLLGPAVVGKRALATTIAHQVALHLGGLTIIDLAQQLHASGSVASPTRTIHSNLDGYRDGVVVVLADAPDILGTDQHVSTMLEGVVPKDVPIYVVATSCDPERTWGHTIEVGALCGESRDVVAPSVELYRWYAQQLAAPLPDTGDIRKICDAVDDRPWFILRIVEISLTLPVSEILAADNVIELLRAYLPAAQRHTLDRFGRQPLNLTLDDVTTARTLAQHALPWMSFEQIIDSISMCGMMRDQSVLVLLRLIRVGIVHVRHSTTARYHVSSLMLQAIAALENNTASSPSTALAS